LSGEGNFIFWVLTLFSGHGRKFIFEEGNEAFRGNCAACGWESMIRQLATGPRISQGQERYWTVEFGCLYDLAFARKPGMPSLSIWNMKFLLALNPALAAMTVAAAVKSAWKTALSSACETV